MHQVSPQRPLYTLVDQNGLESPHGSTEGIKFVPQNSCLVRLHDEIEIVEAQETYDDVNGKYQFTGTAVVYRSQASSLFHVFLTNIRKPSAKLYQLANSLPLEQGTLIPTSAYAPKFPSNKSLSLFAPRLSAPVDIYIKRPSLIGFDRYKQLGRPTAIAEDVLQEANVCEVLLRSPHPALAKYYGCEISDDGRITGLCFAKYKETLMERVNPRGYMKRRFKYSTGLLKDRDGLLHRLRDGIDHLHSLGLVHNDINPSNVMLDDDENPVIIDFGSCTKVGQGLQGVGRTYEWHDAKVQTSMPGNDLYALEELGEWLSEKQLKVFRFEE